MKLLAALAASLIAASPALADTASLFREGKFVEAAHESVREASPKALVLGARSVLAVAAYRTTDKDRAIQLCGNAAIMLDSVLAKNPRDSDAILQKGIALGYTAKLQRSPGGAKEARKLMDQARSLAPGDAVAWAALGGWHGESIATLGAFLAGTALGAKRAEFVKSSEKALTLDPDSPLHPTFYAFTLLALDADNAPRATELLARAISLPARDGFEAMVRAQAVQVLPLLRKRDIDGARALAKQLQAFGTVN